MLYDQARLAGDPTYAPGVSSTKDRYYWKPSPAMVKAGYSKQIYRLDGDELQRAAQARELTRDMLAWATREEPLIEPGTWHWLIRRYRHDDISPFQDVKANTKADYLFSLNRWESAIGQVQISDTDFPAIKRWQQAMQKAGRSDHYIKSMFTKLRIVTNYGVQLKAPGARDVSDILAHLRVKAPKARTVTATEDQVMAVVRHADAAGHPSFALGILLQWWLTLRSVDVRGQWLTEKTGKRWADGLTWDMIDRDLSTIRKTPSKTEDSAPEVLHFDLTPLPDIRARLASVPQEQRVGPVIKDKAGTPYARRQWAALWRRYATEAGVPAEVWMMDTRAGALNHARRLGAEPYDMRNQANHASLDTTDRYMRERSDSINKVIQLRSAK